MRIVLVHPAGSNWVPGKKDITATANRMAPLGLLSIAACLDREGHEVFIHDALGPEAVPGLAENVRRILSHDPDLVGFSATTSGFLDGLAPAEVDALAAHLRETARRHFERMPAPRRDTPTIVPEFEPGDALMFDEHFLHRTYLPREMTDPRYALECWFFAPSRHTSDYVPLLA